MAANPYSQLTGISEQLVRTCLTVRHHTVWPPLTERSIADGMAFLAGSPRPFLYQVKCHTRSAYPDTYAIKTEKLQAYRRCAESGFPMHLFIVNLPHQTIYRQDLAALDRQYKTVVEDKVRFYPLRLKLPDTRQGMRDNVEYHMGQFEAFCKLTMEECAALTLAAK